MTDQAGQERDFWERRAAAWDRRADEVSSFVDTYGGAALDALAVQAGERVLDVGCGPGTTTIELARQVGPDGEVVGVDISEAMIDAAGRRADASTLSNVRFVVADAGTEPLGDLYDAVFSRFGVMFFLDPTAAFANIGRALRPGGRMAWAVWGQLFDNPWMFLPTLAAAPVLQAELPLPDADQPGPFSLADPDRVRALLAEAGFVGIGLQEVEGARVINPDHADEDVRMLFEIGPLGDAYVSADEPTRAAAVAAVLEAIEPHRDGDGWRLPGKGFTVTARRPG
jgi:SAM-dependent methyltransferase